MKSVVWFKNSLDSLQSIYNYIYENSPQNAKKSCRYFIGFR